MKNHRQEMGWQHLNNQRLFLQRLGGGRFSFALHRYRRPLFPP